MKTAMYMDVIDRCYKEFINYHHVQDHVSKCVFVVGIGVAINEQIVGALIIAARRPRKRKFTQVRQSFVVGVFCRLVPLLVFWQEETPFQNKNVVDINAQKV